MSAHTESPAPHRLDSRWRLKYQVRNMITGGLSLMLVGIFYTAAVDFYLDQQAMAYVGFIDGHRHLAFEVESIEDCLALPVAVEQRKCLDATRSSVFTEEIYRSLAELPLVTDECGYAEWRRQFLLTLVTVLSRTIEESDRLRNANRELRRALEMIPGTLGVWEIDPLGRNLAYIKRRLQASNPEIASCAPAPLSAG